MRLPERKDLDVEDFKIRWQFSPDQLANTKLTQEELEGMQEFLLYIELREEIADWELEDVFFLYQDEGREKYEDYILRFFAFSKGLTKCWLLISCFPQIEVTSENMDMTLLASISNILLGQLIRVFVSK